MSDETFNEIYNTCVYYMEDCQIDELEAMDWDQIRELSIREVDEGDSPKAHYMLGNYYIHKGDMETAMNEKLKAAYLGHIVSAIEYSNRVGSDGLEILGIAKAMNDASIHLASEQEDIDYNMQKIDTAKKEKVFEIAEEVKKSMKEKNLEFFW